MAYPAIVAFDVCVLLRLARLDVVDPDAARLSPCFRQPAEALRASIKKDYLRRTAPLYDLIQATQNPQRKQRKIHFYA